MKSCRLSPEATKKERFQLQKLAREELKLKLLTDILLDIEVCKIEGWDYKQYLNELKDLINNLI